MSYMTYESKCQRVQFTRSKLSNCSAHVTVVSIASRHLISLPGTGRQHPSSDGHQVTRLWTPSQG